LSKSGALVWNRIVSLKDSWAKAVQVAETGRSAGQEQQVERRKERDAKKQAQQAHDKTRSTPLGELAEALVRTHAIAPEQARGLTAHGDALALFEASVRQGADAKTIAGLVLGEVARETKANPDFRVSPERLVELAKLLSAGQVTARAARDVLVELVKTNDSAEAVVTRLGVQRVDDEGALGREIDQVLDGLKEKVQAYRAGNRNLIGLFVGQVMQRTRGSADPVLVQRLLRERLGD
jgi:glutaminyl-tRNA synthetase